MPTRTLAAAPWRTPAFLALLALTGMSLIAATASAQDLTIERFSANGTGCRPGSVAANISPDRQAMTIMFDNFVVEATPAVRLQTKVCDIDAVLKVASGWSVALVTADTRGYASLQDPESFGRVRSIYAFARTREPITVLDKKFTGPYDNDYQLRTEGALDTIEWSPCGGKRAMKLRTRIQARLALKSKTGSTLITVDSVDQQVTQKYLLQWKRCGRDDAADTGVPPRLSDSRTVTCQALLKDRQRNVVAVIEGSASGLVPNAVRNRAMLDAMKQCRADRRAAGPGFTCERGNERDCVTEES